ncbi:Rieske (2Fe-2S) protein [Pseudonocardia sp. CA-107938]|uniref:Rieske (2Fe-2S) protein n=1 Tax=Pseudonocardia sp. CA-107938 TaxID=3240021 RepID=UPI003D905E9F
MTGAPAAPPTRRAVLVGACAVCATGVLAACADAAGQPAVATPGTALGSTADVPVGGGRVLPEQGVVLVQPTAGTFAAYSARCTHAGCSVGSVEDGAIVCPCHGSRFAIADGAVLKGPATRPLEKKQVTVSGTAITLA